MKSILRRCTSILLVLVLFCGMFASALLSNPRTVKAASATDRITSFIGLAAGKVTSSADSESIMSLTQDELQFLGIYLSNFYIPYGTELGTANTEILEKEKEQMKTALTNSLKFNEDVAETLVDTIIGLSRSNNQKLEFRVSKKYQKDYVKLEDLDYGDEEEEEAELGKGFSLNYYTFVSIMSGSSQLLKNGGTLHRWRDALQPEGEDPYIYGYFGYERDGEFLPMFDCGLNSNILTPSMVMFDQCLNSVDWVSGYGFNFYDFTKDEAEDSSELKDILSNVSDDNIYRMSAYGAEMVVDCFGNIIEMGGNHQYVVVPACVNPYTWTKVNEDGVDTSTGVYCNIVNFTSMALADQGNLIDGKKWSSEKTARGYRFKQPLILSKTMADNSSSLSGTSDILISGSLFNSNWVSLNPTIHWRLSRGSTATKVDDSLLWGGNGIDLLEQVESGARNANPNGTAWMYIGAYGGVSEIPSPSITLNDYIDIPAYFCADTAKFRNKIQDKVVMIDNLGAFGFDNSSSSIDYNAIQFINYIDDDGNSPIKYLESSGSAGNFTSIFQNIDNGSMNIEVAPSDQAVVAVYSSYAIAGLYDEEGKENTIGKLGYRISKDKLPAIENSPVNLPSGLAEDLVNTTIRNWVYYLLHPSQGKDYIRTLIRNKVNAILVDWHNHMVGTEGIGVVTGTTHYRTNYGYVTTPDLSEMQWTSSLISFYNSMIPFLIIMMVVTMLLAFVTGVMSLQKCFFAVLIFSMFLLVPVNAINLIVSSTNRITSNIYGEKFTYWAVIQEETYGSALDEAATGESYENYLRTLYAENQLSSQGGQSIVLKWQAPKKLASLMLSKGDNDFLKGIKNSSLVSSVLRSNAYSGESYLEGDNQYLYRDYSDIANFSRYIYNGLKIGTRKSAKQLSSSNVPRDYYPDLSAALNNIGTVYNDSLSAGYTNGPSSYSDNLRLVVPMSSSIYRNAIQTQSRSGYIAQLPLSSYVGLNQDLFNFSVAMFNNSSSSFKKMLLENVSEGNKSKLKAAMEGYSAKDFSGLAGYSLMSESPFYYFSWGLYDMGMSSGASAYNGYKSLLLNSENDFFYNESGNGELKDFMDMRSLFTYVIPYLKMGNDIVAEWDNTRGIFTYDGVPTTEGKQKDSDIKENKYLKYKYWHNLNVARLYEIYTPWVDLMYDCSYAQSETIRYMGEKYLVQDPINPQSYPENRPMIFSESEMYDYGLNEADLTSVERLILDANRGMQERMYELLNYYNFSDLSLNTAAAINCVFEFNTTFSENGIFSSNINLYPQSFEIKDFSYDAFLRFILSTTVSEDMVSSKTFYQDIVDNSSTTSAILMLILDVLSQYAIPAFKVFFLILILISSILLILATAFKVDSEMRFIPKLSAQIFMPMVKFFVTTIGFAYVISLFMGVGNNAVTESKTNSISLGDPSMVMLAMCAINIVLLILYFIILKGVVKDIIQNFKLVASFEGGILGGVVAGVTGIMTGGAFNKVRGGSFGSGSSGGNGGYNGTGVSSESSRATKRSQTTNPEGIEGYDDRRTRINDVKRRTAEFNNNKKTDKEREKNINNATKRGTDKLNNNNGRSNVDTGKAETTGKEVD